MPIETSLNASSSSRPAGPRAAVATDRGSHGPLRVGIGGPVGSGKTALTLLLCRHLRERYEVAVVTNDIYTREGGFLPGWPPLGLLAFLGAVAGGIWLLGSIWRSSRPRREHGEEKG